MNEITSRIRALLSLVTPRCKALLDAECGLLCQATAALDSPVSFYAAAAQLLDPASIGKPIHVQIDIHGVGQAFGFAAHQFSSVEFSPVDLTMHRCTSSAYGGGLRLAELQKHIGDGQRRFDAVIIPLTVPIDEAYTKTIYFIESLTATTTALQLVQAQPSQACTIVATLEGLRNQVVAAFSVKNLNPRLSAAIDAVILQALALSHHPIHICSISPPAMAKGLLQNIARGIAPIYITAGAKYSMAGLVGSLYVLKGGLRFPDPGFLMRANNGVLGLEDVHNLFIGRHEPLVHVLASAMEGGIANDSTRHRMEYHFSTSILADANPSSSIGVTGTELRIPGNLLSRFTAIFHFDSGFSDVLGTAMAMLGSMHRDEAAIRAIRVHLAALRTQAPYPAWGAAAERAAHDLLGQIAGTMDSVDQELTQSHLVRSANGLRAMAMAHAVLRRAAEVTAADIQAVSHVLLIRYQSLGEILAHREDTVESAAAKDGRQGAVLERFSGRDVTPGDVHRFYREQGWELDRKTVYRDLRDLERSGRVGRARGLVSFPGAAMRHCPIAP